MKPETVLINLTPHPVTIKTEDGFSITLNPDGPPPSLEPRFVEIPSPIDTIRIMQDVAAPTGLPAELVNQILIVPKEVATHRKLTHRTDLAYPGEPVRWCADGRVTAHRGLCAGPGLARSLKISQDWTVADTGHPNDGVCPNCGSFDHPAEKCAHRLAP